VPDTPNPKAPGHALKSSARAGALLIEQARRTRSQYKTFWFSRFGGCKCKASRRNWWTWSGSNRRPLPCHGSALPAAPQAHNRGKDSDRISSRWRVPIQLNSPPLLSDSQTPLWHFANLWKICILNDVFPGSSIPKPNIIRAKRMMKRFSRKNLRLLPALLLASSFLAGQVPADPQSSNQAPISYSSMNQLNTLLGNLEQTSQNSAADLKALRVDRWKTDGNTKRQEQSDVESLLRNLQNALPGLVNELRNSPEDMAATFKLYHNLDSLHYVISAVAVTAGAFGPKGDYQAL